MKILVCIKQVPDTEANPELRRDLSWINEDNLAFRMNRYDEYALEEALVIKDEFPETVIDVITVGPERSAAIIRKGLEKGADSAVHIKTAENHISAADTASLIADYASGRGYDIIFAGVMSEDMMQCMVGPMVASLLSMPCIVSVVKTSVDFDSGIITAESELEGGIIETVELSAPCLITIQTGINQPRYPSLSNVMKARGMTHQTVEADHFIKNRVSSLSYPERGAKGTEITGSIEEKADKLVELLYERGLLV
ncbi:MAG TPA: electron transfer flavoprotein subunit beta/FixA family protein [Spirochaetota bacterium]|nr:electron transfer flavoprotein subunit beta/FixA family protein [Spirochaetota bacterium]